MQRSFVGVRQATILSRTWQKSKWGLSKTSAGWVALLGTENTDVPARAIIQLTAKYPRNIPLFEASSTMWRPRAVQIRLVWSSQYPRFCFIRSNASSGTMVRGFLPPPAWTHHPDEPATVSQNASLRSSGQSFLVVARKCTRTKKFVHEDQRVIARRAGLTHLGLSFSLHLVRT